MNTDLTKRLWKAHYVPDEFAAALSAFYHRSVGSTGETAFGDQDSPSVILQYRRDGSIERVRAGPGFLTADLEPLSQAIATALDQSEPAVRRFLVTTYRPLVGALGFDEWFALLPAPDNAPRPSGDYFGGHPAVLEVQVAGSSDHWITFRRARRALLELEALFALLTKEALEAPGASPRFQWVIDPADDTNLLYARAIYQIPDFAAEAAALSDITPYADIEYVETDRYYAPGFHGSAVLALPKNFFPLLAHFRRIDDGARARFLRAGYWAKLQGEMGHVSKAATYAAIIRAIEALMPAAPLAEPCDTCGERPSRGTRQAFAKFVDDMTGSEISEKDRLRFYDRRSRLVHGDALFALDEQLVMSGPRELTEMSELDTITGLARILFHNWLCEQPSA